jgi:tetratricopeptide (TPR) repeat protein
LSEKNRSFQAIIYFNLGNLVEELGNFNDALYKYKLALNIKDEYGDRCFQAKIYFHIGMVWHKLEDLEKAESYYKKALTIWIHYGKYHEQADIFHNLGLIAQDFQEIEQAKEYYLKALKIWIDFNNKYCVFNVSLLQIGFLYLITQDESILTAVAAILKITVEKLEELLLQIL